MEYKLNFFFISVANNKNQSKLLNLFNVHLKNICTYSFFLHYDDELSAIMTRCHISR